MIINVIKKVNKKMIINRTIGKNNFKNLLFEVTCTNIDFLFLYFK